MPFTPRVFYKDPRAALEWLEKAFGFETSLLVTDEAGDVVHSEMTFAGDTVHVAGEVAQPDWEWRRSPASAGGVNTQMVNIQLERDIDAHCERARAAGAVISHGPQDQPYGERDYHAVDPEGHHWGFSMHLRDVSNQEMEASMGLKVQTSL